MMTETEAEIRLDKVLDNKIPNLRLNDLLMKHARRLQAPNCQPPRQRTGSTDFANVMHRVPGSCIRVAFVPDGTSSHSPEFIAAGKSEAAHRAVVFGAKILADTVLELVEIRKNWLPSGRNSRNVWLRKKSDRGVLPQLTVNPKICNRGRRSPFRPLFFCGAETVPEGKNCFPGRNRNRRIPL